MKRSHLIRLNTTPQQEGYFRKACGVARHAYNWALARWKDYRAEGKWAKMKDLKEEYNRIKGPRDTQRVSQRGEKALKNEQKRRKSGYLRENSLAGRCWKEWKQGVSSATVTPRWEKQVCYRIPFKEQAPQTYPLLGTML